MKSAKKRFIKAVAESNRRVMVPREKPLVVEKKKPKRKINE